MYDFGSVLHERFEPTGNPGDTMPDSELRAFYKIRLGISGRTLHSELESLGLKSKRLKKDGTTMKAWTGLREKPFTGI